MLPKMFTAAQDQGDIERIIRSSVLESTIAARLAAVPLDDRPQLLATLGGAVKVVFYEQRFNGEWLTEALVGRVGRDEFSNEPRVLWRREFPTPLPPVAKVRDAVGCAEVFKISINGTDYKFSKAEGVYLGCTPAPSAT